MYCACHQMPWTVIASCTFSDRESRYPKVNMKSLQTKSFHHEVNRRKMILRSYLKPRQRCSKGCQIVVSQYDVQPKRGDIFECCFKAQSSKLESLFSLKRGKRDFQLWALSFRKCYPKWDAPRWTNRTLAFHERVKSRFLSIAWLSFHPYSILLVWNVLAYCNLSVNFNIKVSKTLNHLASFRFCGTQHLHFTTRVFSHSTEISLTERCDERWDIIIEI